MVEFRAACQWKPEYPLMAQAFKVLRNTYFIGCKDEVCLPCLIDERFEPVGIFNHPPGEGLFPTTSLSEFLDHARCCVVHAEDKIGLFGLINKMAVGFQVWKQEFEADGVNPGIDPRESHPWYCV